MITKVAVERLIRMAQGGTYTDEQRLDYQYMKSQLNVFRATTIRILYVGDRYTGKNTRINNLYYQSFYPEYSKFLQTSDCFNVFEVPPVVSLDDKSDGFRYIGTVDNSLAFKRITDRADLSNLNNLSKFAPKDSTFISALYVYPYIEIYGQNVKEFKIEAVFQNPFEIPTFNEYYDEYPMSESDFSKMEQMVYREQTAIEMSRPADDISDSGEPNIQMKK